MSKFDLHGRRPTAAFDCSALVRERVEAVMRFLAAARMFRELWCAPFYYDDVLCRVRWSVHTSAGVAYELTAGLGHDGEWYVSQKWFAVEGDL